MSDEGEPVTAVAKAVEESGKAVQETMKTGRALIQPGTDLAQYVARCLGTVPEDVIAFLIGDPLHELRQHTLTGILRAAFEKLSSRRVKTAKTIRPGPGKEAFEGASLETDPTLQEMWANLLANAMDPNRNTTLRQIFIDTLKQFEPLDAVILQEQVRPTKSFTRAAAKKKVESVDLIAKLKVRPSQFQLSVLHLEKLDCVEHSATMSTGGQKFFSDIAPTALGIELYLACTDDAPD